LGYYPTAKKSRPTPIRNEAAVGLVLIPRQWETALPPLIEYLESVKTSSGWEITHAVELFGQLGANAKPAVPLLVSLLNHSDPRVREALTNHLAGIDADAAAKAGMKRDQ